MIGLWDGDIARAHPLSLLSAYEAVDDDLGGPVFVMYYLIYRGGMVAERVADGAPARSDASGLLWTPLASGRPPPRTAGCPRTARRASSTTATSCATTGPAPTGADARAGDLRSEDRGSALGATLDGGDVGRPARPAPRRGGAAAADPVVDPPR